MTRAKLSSICSALAQKILGGLVSQDAQSVNGYVVALFSRRSGEGVTMICHELARAITAQRNLKLLCIDAGDGRSRLMQRCGGSGQLLSAETLAAEFNPAALLAASAHETPQRISVLALAEPSVMRSKGWPTFLGHIRACFDMVIVDCGSLDRSTPYAWNDDATVKLLVVDAAHTTMPMLERLRSDLNATGFDVSGIVLNRMEQVIPNFVYRHLV